MISIISINENIIKLSVGAKWYKIISNIIIYPLIVIQVGLTQPQKPVPVDLSQSSKSHQFYGSDSECLCQSIYDTPLATETVRKLQRLTISLTPRNTFGGYGTSPSLPTFPEIFDKEGESICYCQPFCDQVEDEAGIHRMSQNFDRIRSEPIYKSYLFYWYEQLATPFI